jgi:exodeoxyribonuclease V alpha subunit
VIRKADRPAVVIPLATQHYMLLQRNLIYTGITRGNRLLVLIGQKKALGIAVRNDRPQRRYSGLLASLKVPSIDQMCPLTRK